MSDHEKHGHQAHAGHGHDDHAHTDHGHDTHGHGGGHGKKPWNLLAAMAAILILIAIFAIRESQTANRGLTLNVTPGPENAISTDITHILSNPPSYHGKVVKLTGVFGFKAGDTRAKNYELFDPYKRSIRMNITGFDYPRVVPYEVLARVDASKLDDPFLNVLRVDPLYETPIEN